MVDGLSAILTSLAPLDAAPDADSDFLNNLRSLIATKIKETTAADLQSQASMMAPTTGPSAAGADLAGNIGPPPMAPTPGGMGMGMNAAGPMPGAMGAGAPGPGRGTNPAPPMPNPDELRRVLNIG